MFWRDCTWVSHVSSYRFSNLWVKVFGHVWRISAIIFRVPFFGFPLRPPLLGFVGTTQSLVLCHVSPGFSSFIPRSVFSLSFRLVYFYCSVFRVPSPMTPKILPLSLSAYFNVVIVFCSFRVSHLVFLGIPSLCRDSFPLSLSHSHCSPKSSDDGSWGALAR